MMFISNLNYVAICVVGGLRVANGTMSLGDVQAFIVYAAAVHPADHAGRRDHERPPVDGRVASASSSCSTSPRRRPMTRSRRSWRPPRSHHPNGVSFRYLRRPLIEDLTLNVPAGETVAIVRPDRRRQDDAREPPAALLRDRRGDDRGGRRRHAPPDVTQRAPAAVRDVLQDPWLFRGTIRDNIAYGREAATDERNRGGRSRARVDHFVHTLPRASRRWSTTTRHVSKARSSC